MKTWNSTRYRMNLQEMWRYDFNKHPVQKTSKNVCLVQGSIFEGTVMRTKTKVCKIFILKNGLKIEWTDSGRRRTLHAHGDRNTWRKESRGGNGVRLFACLAKGGVSWGRERLLELERLFEEIRWFVVGWFASFFSPRTNGHFQYHGLLPF